MYYETIRCRWYRLGNRNILDMIKVSWLILRRKWNWIYFMFNVPLSLKCFPSQILHSQSGYFDPAQNLGFMFFLHRDPMGLGLFQHTSQSLSSFSTPPLPFFPQYPDVPLLFPASLLPLTHLLLLSSSRLNFIDGSSVKRGEHEF